MNDERVRIHIADWIKIVVTIGGFALAGLGGYYDLRQRVALNEQKMEQESRGYYLLQVDLARRLDRFEVKLDLLTEKLFREREWTKP